MTCFICATCGTQYAPAPMPPAHCAICEDERHIPMKPADVRRMRLLLAERRFADVHGYAWGRNIIGAARAAVERSFDRYLDAVAA